MPGHDYSNLAVNFSSIIVFFFSLSTGSKIAKKLLQEERVDVIDWPVNSPDFNPILNCWNWMKDQVQEVNTNSVEQLIAEIKKLWVQHTPVSYLNTLMESMPRWRAAAAGHRLGRGNNHVLIMYILCIGVTNK